MLASETKKSVSETQILACSPLNLTNKLLKKGTSTVVHILPYERLNNGASWTEERQTEGQTDRWTDSSCDLQDFVPFRAAALFPLNLDYILGNKMKDV